MGGDECMGRAAENRAESRCSELRANRSPGVRRIYEDARAQCAIENAALSPSNASPVAGSRSVQPNS
jgi:hypothetical protein